MNNTCEVSIFFYSSKKCLGKFSFTFLFSILAQYKLQWIQLGVPLRDYNKCMCEIKIT